MPKVIDDIELINAKNHRCRYTLKYYWHRNDGCHGDTNVPARDLSADLSLLVQEQLLVSVYVLTTCHLQNKPSKS